MGRTRRGDGSLRSRFLANVLGVHGFVRGVDRSPLHSVRHLVNSDVDPDCHHHVRCLDGSHRLRKWKPGHSFKNMLVMLAFVLTDWANTASMHGWQPENRTVVPD